MNSQISPLEQQRTKVEQLKRWNRFSYSALVGFFVLTGLTFWTLSEHVSLLGSTTTVSLAEFSILEAETPLGHPDRLKKMDEFRANTKARFDHFAFGLPIQIFAMIIGALSLVMFIRQQTLRSVESQILAVMEEVEKLKASPNG
jgi:hypothetical protein